MNNNKMGIMPMPKLVINMSLPLMFSLLIQSLYNIVDSIFVAKVGEKALTATSLAFPIQLLMIAVAVGTSVGINALLSKSVGANELELTENIATSGVILALIGTVLFMIFGFLFTGWFTNCFTDDSAIQGYTQQYLYICMVFCAGTFIGTMYQRFLQSVGDTLSSMITLVVGAVINLILDPILIFGLLGFPKLGVSGAAIATVIGQWSTAILAIYLNTVKNPIVSVKIRNYKINKTVFKQIYKVGLPTIITQALGSVMVIGVNVILMPFSSTMVAFFGVYYKLQNFLFMPMNGLGQAAIPIVGFNYGAKKNHRVIELIKTMIPIAVGIAIIASLVFMIFPSTLLSFFSASSSMLEIGLPALRIISITFAFASVTMILGYAVSGLGNGVINMLGTALRQFIILVPLIYFIARYINVNYVWYAFWFSEITAMLYAIFATRKILLQKNII